MQSKKRQGNFDVLKIISIFLIVLHHYALWSSWKFLPGVQLNKIAAETLIIGGKLGVNLFVMITGYFMIHSRPKMKNLITIWVETTVISIFIYILTVILHLGNQEFSVKTFIYRAFPVVFGQYWFVVAYTLLYLSIPLLNKLLLSTEIKKIEQTLRNGFIVLSLYTYVYYRMGLNFSYPIWLSFLYCIGAFLRLKQSSVKKIDIRITSLLSILVVFLCIGINILLQYFFSKPDLFITKFLSLFGWHETIFYTRDASPLLLILAILIFITFMNIQISPKRIYTFLGRAAFGVYLFHTAPWFGSEFLIPVVLNSARFSSSKTIIFYAILSATFIYIVGVIIYFCLLPLIKLIVSLLKKPTMFLQKKIFE